jgi:hypothetical protein
MKHTGSPVLQDAEDSDVTADSTQAQIVVPAGREEPAGGANREKKRGIN